jgi:hypothetical protein
MALVDPFWAGRIVFILGITNLAGFFLVLFSCRCIPGLRRGLLAGRKYQAFYRYHCWYWWFFLASVFVHSVFALIVYGIPV